VVSMIGGGPRKRQAAAGAPEAQPQLFPSETDGE
jgi:hypothetical protein